MDMIPGGKRPPAWKAATGKYLKLVISRNYLNSSRPVYSTLGAALAFDPNTAILNIFENFLTESRYLC